MNLLTKKRKALGFSQAKLARLAEINQTTLCKLENGKETLYPAWGERIARALDWKGDPSELMEEVDA